MARTWKDRGDRISYDKESTDVRRWTLRQYRRRCDRLIKKGRWDDITPFKKTGGWITW
jgi:hypothetical protein